MGGYLTSMGYVAIAIIALGGFAAVGVFVYRLIKEIGPTIRQAKSTANALQDTLQQSKEIGENFKSISEAIQRERAEFQVTKEAARQTVGEITNLVSIVRPMGDTLQLLKRRTEPQPVPAKATRFLQKVQNKSRKAWERVSKTVQKKISADDRSAVRMLKFSGIPLTLGTAAGAYAVYLKRRRNREKFEESSAHFTRRDRNNG